MKSVKFIIPLFAIFILIMFNGCIDVGDGPMGPQGPAGNANVKSFIYTIYPNDWLASNDPNLWYYDKRCDFVTEDIVDFGAVLFFLKETSGNLSWISLPTTSLYRDNGQAYTTEYQPWHSDFTLSIQWIDTHPTNPRKPTWNCTIKAIIIADYAYNMLKAKGVDVKNYEQVMSALNLSASN